MGTVTIGIAQTLLDKDTEPLRFERFCVDLVSEMEGGARIVTTSGNYDKGRDGVSVGGPLSVFVMCSLADDVDGKALRDAKSLFKGKGPGRKVPDAVYFCSSQQFTEKRSDDLIQLIRTELSVPAGFDRVDVLSGLKLAQLGSKLPGLFEKHYPGELSDIKRVLADTPDAAEAEHALRLALSISDVDEAADIREEVWQALLRLHLSKGDATAGDLAASISNYLKLSSALSSHVLVHHLDALLHAGHVDSEDGLYSLTTAGRQAYEEDEARVARGIFKGKEALTAALKVHLRTEITDDQADKMWNAVQEQLATLFHERGQEVLGQVAKLIEKKSEDGKDEADREFDLVKSLAIAAAAPFAHPEQKREVETALRDIMIEGDSVAVRWLTRTAYAFVCACAMGLEAKTRSALEDVIGGTNLIFDTDVVLSYLSPDEPAYDAVKAIRERWRSLGGKVLLAEEVNFEVAYHAWIAQTDSEHTGSHILSSKVDRHVLSKNAFVRGFWMLVSKRKARKHQWASWIGQFRGRQRNDTSVTHRTLTQDHGFGVLPPPSGPYRKLAEKARLFLEEKQEQAHSVKCYDEHDEFVRGDKASRDAQLFAATVQIREKGHEGGEATFLLTSSGRFTRLGRKLRPHDESFVLTIPTVLYLISMAPDRGLGLTALRAFLFDERWKERLSDFELMALRVVRKSDEFDMPWAKRGTLMRRLKERVHRVAKDRSKGERAGARVSDVDVAKEWTTAEGKEQMLQELAGALDDVASDRRGEIVLAKAREEIAELKRQLAERDRAQHHSKKPR